MATRRPLVLRSDRLIGELPDADQIPLANVPGGVVGKALLALASAGAVRLIRVNADGSVDLRAAADYRGDLGLGTMATEAAADYVTVATAQTVTGQKTWTDEQQFGSGSFGNWTNLRQVQVVSGSSAGVAIQSGTTGIGRYAFGDDTLVSFLEHNHSSDVLRLAAIAHSNMIALSSTGTAITGNTSITGTLSTTGAAAIGSGLTVDGVAPYLFLRETSGGADNEAYIVHFQKALLIQNRTTAGAFVSTPFSLSIEAPDGSFRCYAASMVINEFGQNYDFRVEGDTDANLLFCDASADRVGIGTSSPSEKLSVAGNISATKAVLIEDVYQITAVSTAGQTRTLDLANGAVQTISANQAFTINATGPAGKSGHLILYVYNSSGSAIFCPLGTNWFNSGTLAIGANTTTAFDLRWDGTRCVYMYDAFAAGDLRPT